MSARPLRDLAVSYVNGYQMILLQKQVRNCANCSAEAKTTSSTDELGRTVRNPTPKLNFFIRELFRIATDEMSDKCVIPNLRAYMTEKLTEETYTVFSCPDHDFLTIVIERFLHFFIHTWCSRVNNVLQGKEVHCITVTSTAAPEKPTKGAVKYLRTVHEEAKVRFTKYRTRNRALAQEKKLIV